MADAMGCKVYEEKIKINADDIKEDELESTKAEMTGVKEENLRLKTLLQQVEKDYKTLQMRFMDIIQQESKKSQDDREHELVSLRLGSVTDRKRDDSIHVASANSNSSKSGSENDELKLGLECNFEVSKDGDGCPGKREDDLEVVKKTERSGDEECSQTSVKRARVCVRARCDTPTMNDGCQWRKYGQKISKGNPCPRSYYRCTVSPSCPVRKQVQRSAEDMSILTTTYEGTHNHPLPLSATAMASTTSAAASMLLSGSTTSQPSANTAGTPTSLYRPPFQSSNNSTTQPYYYNSSPTAFPTITLDLTTNPSATSSGFGLSPSSFQMTPRVPTTSLSFSSMNSNMMIPAAWGSGALSYGTLPYNNNHHSLQFGKPIQEQNYQPYLEKFNQGSSQQALTETLTKVITSDPSFRSVIEAAISSMSANGSPGKLNNSKGESLGPELKWGDHKPSADGNPLT